MEKEHTFLDVLLIPWFRKRESMDRNTRFYKIGPVVIEMQYKGVLPKVEPPQVTEFRIEYANNVNLSYQVSLGNENNDEKMEACCLDILITMDSI